MGNRQTRTFGHALIIGGSMAGLLAARVLSDYFTRVTLLERDQIQHSFQPRRGVPQGRQGHVLLSSGQQALEQLFPGIIAELTDKGLLLVNMGADVRWHHFGYWKTNFHSDISLLFVNRPLLEWCIAAKVLALPNVEIVEGCAVQGFLGTAETDRDSPHNQSRITGIKVGNRAKVNPEQLEPADLIVDASGKGSQTPRWLQQLGYPEPPETRIDVKVGYASRIYQCPHTHPDWQGLFIIPRPPDTRAGAIFPIDGDRWLVTLAGWVGDYPPGDEDGFLDFARSLCVPDLYVALQQAEPLSEIVPHRFLGNHRRYFERMPYAPESLIVIGDALCSFNPIYGQGMSVSALDAIVLRECLAQQVRTRGKDLTGFSQRFQQQVAAVTDLPWQLAISEDFRYPQVSGHRPLGTRFNHWYAEKVHQAAAHDPEVAQCFYRVLHLLDKPTSLFRPNIVRRVLCGQR